MKQFLSILMIVFFISCATPITQSSFTYTKSDAMDKMIVTLVDTKWEITHTDQSSGLIVAKKLPQVNDFFLETMQRLMS